MTSLAPPKDSIQKHIFTQLHIALIKDQIKEENGLYSIELFTKGNLSIPFMKESAEALNQLPHYVIAKQIEGPNNVRFFAKSECFDSKDDFKKKMINSIKDNNLSWLHFPKTNFIKAFLQDKFMKSEIDFYKLDKFYESNTPISINYSKEESAYQIDGGATLRFQIESKDNAILHLFERIKATQEKYLQPEIKNKNRPKI